jgi:hypothetical protein
MFSTTSENKKEELVLPGSMGGRGGGGTGPNNVKMIKFKKEEKN